MTFDPTAAPAANDAEPSLRRVLHVISDLSVGGAEMMLCNLLSATDRARFAPVVISLANRGALGERIAGLNVPVYSPRINPRLPTPAAWLRFCRLIRRLQPDVIHGWMYHGNLAAMSARKLGYTRAPIVWSVHCSLPLPRSEKFRTVAAMRLGARWSSAAVRIVYVSQTSYLQHEALGYCATNSAVLPNGIDPNEFAPDAAARAAIRAELGIAADVPLVGAIGRFHPMKDHATLLRAMRLIVARQPAAHLMLAGRRMDEDNQKLAALANELKLNGRVHFLGERRDVARLLSAPDVFVLSSAYGESFPVVLAEAMACGVPCVTTNIGDSAWAVGETGLTVQPHDADALATACCKILEMPPDARRKLGLNARARVEENFSLASVARHYEDIYTKAMQEQVIDKP